MESTLGKFDWHSLAKKRASRRRLLVHVTTAVASVIVHRSAGRAVIQGRALNPIPNSLCSFKTG